MKAVKIILAIAVVAIIGFLVAKWLINIEEIHPTKPPTNPYTQRIEKEIGSLSNMPENKFCKKYYNDVQAGIDEFYKNGYLGLTSYKDGSIWREKKNENNNNQWKDILSKNLYSAYAPIFVKQAMYVFSRSEWKNDDLKFIRNELRSLKNSTYLTPGEVSLSFDNINTILKKYDEIQAFINACKGFEYPNYELENTYPDVSEQVKKSRAYIANILENNYVNNCTRLKNELKAIPKILFDKHIDYLIKKINNNGARYSEFGSQPVYVETIYKPLNNQIDALNKDIYGVSDNVFENAYNRVYSLLSKHNYDALNFYKNK